MKLNQRILPLLTLLLFGICRHSAAQKKKLPNIVILATGGTIAGVAATGTQAGYTSGAVTLGKCDSLLSQGLGARIPREPFVVGHQSDAKTADDGYTGATLNNNTDSYSAEHPNAKSASQVPKKGGAHRDGRILSDLLRTSPLTFGPFHKGLPQFPPLRLAHIFKGLPLIGGENWFQLRI